MTTKAELEQLTPDGWIAAVRACRDPYLLLDIITEFPEYLTDVYHSRFGAALLFATAETLQSGARPGEGVVAEPVPGRDGRSLQGAVLDRWKARVEAGQELNLYDLLSELTGVPRQTVKETFYRVVYGVGK